MKLLIVDDSAVTRRQMRSSLSKMEGRDFEVFEAEDGKECIAIYKEQQPDLMLLDYLLPDTTGIELLKKLSKGESYLPVIMVTGFGDTELVVEAMRLGAQGYLVKDKLNPDTLYASVEDALGRIENLKEAEKKKKLEQFSYMLAHDMKDKIGSADEILALLSGQVGDKERLIEFLCLANKVAEQMRDFSHDLLDHAIMTSDEPAPKEGMKTGS